MTELINTLADRLAQEIARNGPIRVDTYMAACLADPLDGYYLTRNPFGAEGDFLTAPDTSQIFGELIGLWCVAVWRSMGAPRPFQLIELGPGRGTLMSDCLRAMSVDRDILAAVSCHMVEISPVLSEIQQSALSAATCPVQWHTDLGDIEPGPSIVIANEFFDALPIRQFVKEPSGWHERLITVNGDGQFAFAASIEPVTDLSLLPQDADAAPQGAIWEQRGSANNILALLAARAAAHPLAALIIDYGYRHSGFGDTLQAVRAHDFANPLAAQGEADLTAHVDFASLAHAANTHGFNTFGPVTQARFLLTLGLAQRLEKLLTNATEEQASMTVTGAQRLVDPNEMGELFKVLALTSPQLPPPPAFEA